MAITDDLTGLANRRHFLARLAEEQARLQRQDTQRAAVLMLDLDHFKVINDMYGHAAGDAVLRHSAALMRNSLRQIDQVGRIGGEEFAILLSGADPAAAQVFAERLRQKIAEPVLYESQAIPVTVSIGIAALKAQDATVNAVLHRADAALYRAKAEGRNRVAMADD
jgi:diguanylate cyclase (GGDEF)-like protein